MKVVLLLLCLMGLIAPRAWGVQILVNGTASYNTTEPTGSDIPDWGAGWGSGSVNGWDYVGRAQDAGGVYLGNGWVITAGHVGEGDLYLDGTTYDAVPNSAQTITDSTGEADLTLFQIATSPDLPALSIATEAPSAADMSGSGGSEVAMIGYGSGSETWGLNTVTLNDVTVQVDGYSYMTTDFQTAYGDPPSGFTNLDNDAVLIGGDSGGGDFIYNTDLSEWQLAGINEAVDTSTDDSYMVQLSTYAPQIKAIIAVPEPDTWWLAPMGAVLFLAWRGRGGRSTWS
jgi:hypothetical protein